MANYPDNGLPFSATVTLPNPPLTLIPDGDYLAMIVSHEIRPIKETPRNFVLTRLRILEDIYAGREVFMSVMPESYHKMPRGVTPQQWIRLSKIDCIIRVRHKTRREDTNGRTHFYSVNYVERVL